MFRPPIVAIFREALFEEERQNNLIYNYKIVSFKYKFKICVKM